MPESDFARGLPSILHAEYEAKAGTDYYWNNLPRQPDTTYVLQRTIRGQVLFRRDGQERPADPGTAIIFRYGEPTEYRIGPQSTWPYQLEYVVLGHQGGLGGILGQIRSEFGDIVRMDDKGEAARIVHSLVESFHTGNVWDRLELAGLAYRLVIAIYREQISGTRGSDPVAYLRHQLQDQFRSPKNIKEWIQDLPISREHMTRVFHERYGETPAAYLRMLRLNHARLLAQTSTSMTAEDVAAASGFVSPQTLRRAFRKQFGQSLGSL